MSVAIAAGLPFFLSLCTKIGCSPIRITCAGGGGLRKDVDRDGTVTVLKSMPSVGAKLTERVWPLPAASRRSG